MSILDLLPNPTRRWIHHTRLRFHYGGTKCHCTVCGANLRTFLPGGVKKRPHARCPFCESLERHRLIALFLQRETDLFSRNNFHLLHVAPEPFLTSFIRRNNRGLRITSLDLSHGRTTLRGDLTRLPLRDESFDALIASHVLEHIPDDRGAMRELLRVLKPGGWSILQVPIRGEKTYEDFSITDPAEREKHFGQCDHVRYYGADYKDRLTETGFIATDECYARRYDEARIHRYGLMADERVYFCRKPACDEKASS